MLLINRPFVACHLTCCTTRSLSLEQPGIIWKVHVM